MDLNELDSNKIILHLQLFDPVHFFHEESIFLERRHVFMLKCPACLGNETLEISPTRWTLALFNGGYKLGQGKCLA